MFTNHIYLIYMYKLDLVLNNLQWLICHKIKPTVIYKRVVARKIRLIRRFSLFRLLNK